MRALVLLWCCICLVPAQATWRPYEWLVTIETEPVPGQFKYKGSTIAPVVETHISYAKADGSESTKYETLWYGNGRAYGLERSHNLDIDSGRGVGIRVIHKTQNPTEDEYTAAANSIVRLLLDLRNNRDSIAMIIVPDGSFSGICGQLFTEHFVPFRAPLEVPYQIAGALFIQDESDKHTQTLCYAPNSAGY
jgi:hypothetical protein